MTMDLLQSLPAWARPPALGLGAFVLAAAFTPLVIRLAKRGGWIARPTEDRWHEEPTALMGGIAIFAAAGLAWAALPAGAVPWPLWAGAALMFVTGVADDLRGVSPVAKLVAQVGAATALLLTGHALAPGLSPWISVPLTYLWVIGITNAVNLLDNMDGLAAGVAGIAALAVGGFAMVDGAWGGGAAAAAVAGAAGGFLLYNFKPARVFMGDGGSLFLGFTVAALALVFPGRSPSGTLAAVLVPAAVMAVPILDTTLVTLKRIAAGRSVAQGGRDHSSHRLVFLGLPEREAVLTLYALSALFAGLALGLQFLDLYLTLSLVTVAGVGLVVFGVFLGQIEVRPAGGGDPHGTVESGNPHRGARVVESGETAGILLLRPVMRNKRELALMVGDLLLVMAVFVVAHYLRFEDSLTAGMRDRMVALLPLVAFLKVAVFWAMGLYRGLLRYAGTREMVKVAKASTAASALVVVVMVMAFRFAGLSRAVFVIDWMLATFALAVVRGSLRGLRSYFAGKRREGKRVLLYGAGDAGALALREIRQNPDLGMVPVGFVDDDPEKRGRSLHGLSVLGSGEELRRLVLENEIDQVCVTVGRRTDDADAQMLERCRECGVPGRVLRIAFETSEPRSGKTGPQGG